MCDLFAVVIETLGCRLNQTESEGLAFIFAKAGFKVLGREQWNAEQSNGRMAEMQELYAESSNQNKRHKNTFKIADEVAMPLLCIVNTCTVTSKAEQKARRLIRLLLKKYEKALVLVTGCYAEVEVQKIEDMDERVLTFQGKKKDALIHLPQYLIRHCSPENLATSKNLGIRLEATSITPTTLKNILISFKSEYENIQNKSAQIETLTPLNLNTSKFIPLFALSDTNSFLFHSRATLKVQDGCNNACAFCRIRIARGKAISLPIEEAVRRIKKIEEKGAREVVITGVNLSQYKDGKQNFSHLLARLLEATSRIRIRISSLYPQSITPAFLSVISNKRVCPHFHLSIQSGSDRILAKMGREYTRMEVAKSVQDLRNTKELPFIGCDIIAGFPSETEEDFLLTLQMCKELKFAGIHAFPFSPRPDTLGAKMKDRVSEKIARERVSLLNSIAKKNYDDYLESFEGRTLFGIVEVSGSSLSITTENYLQLSLKMKNKHKAGDGILVQIFKNEAVEV